MSGLLTGVGVGLVACQTFLGLLQERILKGTYGADKVRFGAPTFLILCTRVVALGREIHSRSKTGAGLRSQHVRPQQPLWQLGVVAILSFLASLCEAAALMRISFILLQTSFFPRLFFGTVFDYLVFDSNFSARRWTAALVSISAALIFTTNLPHPPMKDQDSSVIGVILVVTFHILDGVRQILQGRYFAREDLARDYSSTMTIHLMGAVLASASLLLPSLPTTLQLFATSKSLLAHTTLYAVISAILPSLIHSDPTSNSTGYTAVAPLSQSPPASTSSLPPPILLAFRRLFSICVNSLVFETWRKTPFMSWCGVGWAVGAAWIEDDPNYGETDSDTVSGPSPDHVPRHFLLPLAVPVLALLLCRGIFLPSTSVEAAELGSGKLVNGSAGVVILEGGKWEEEFHRAVVPVCLNSTTVRWNGTRRTMLASNPRCGNTWTRELVERTTGFQTSTVSYCDHTLAKTFLGECDGPANFLVKTHFPRAPRDGDLDGIKFVKLNSVHQAVHLVRNPVDSIYSEWQLAHFPKKDGNLDHAGRLNIGRLGSGPSGRQQRKAAMTYAEEWALHEQYWSTVEVPVHRMRYEDLIDYKLPTLMSLLAFLLPVAELPSLSSLACITEQDSAREAYTSRKRPAFGSWDEWEPKLRTEVITRVRKGWCRQGYDMLLRAKRGKDTGVDGICS